MPEEPGGRIQALWMGPPACLEGPMARCLDGLMPGYPGRRHPGRRYPGADTRAPGANHAMPRWSGAPGGARGRASRVPDGGRQEMRVIPGIATDGVARSPNW